MWIDSIGSKEAYIKFFYVCVPYVSIFLIFKSEKAYAK